MVIRNLGCQRNLFQPLLPEPEPESNFKFCALLLPRLLLCLLLWLRLLLVLVFWLLCPWNVSNVRDMSFMFSDAEHFNHSLHASWYDENKPLIKKNRIGQSDSDFSISSAGFLDKNSCAAVLHVHDCELQLSTVATRQSLPQRQFHSQQARCQKSKNTRREQMAGPASSQTGSRGCLYENRD